MLQLAVPANQLEASHGQVGGQDDQDGGQDDRDDQDYHDNDVDLDVNVYLDVDVVDDLGEYTSQGVETQCKRVIENKEMPRGAIEY